MNEEFLNETAKSKSKKLSGSNIVIIIAVIGAIISLFMPWACMGPRSVSGWESKFFWMIVFFIIPAFVAFTNSRINKVLGYLCGLAAIGSGIYAYNNLILTLLGRSLNIAGVGVFAFIAVSFLLLVGVFIENTPKLQKIASDEIAE